MKITVELEVEDEREINVPPTEEEKRTRPTGYRHCYCGSLEFWRIKFEGLPDAPGYGTPNSQSAVPLVMCCQCNRLMHQQ